mgnify:FL=1|jgi:hypothetical protein|tara:strand:+ start:2 stop:2650 length:2649 start_codon:yes stop_codon:yes gene_type:complete
MKEELDRTDSFTEIDQLAEGLRGSGPGKTPQHRKWKRALNKLPKQKKRQYMERAYLNSKLTWEHDGERIDDDKCEKFNRFDVTPDAKIILFRHPDAKGNEIRAFDRANHSVATSNGTVQNLYYPEIVQINYSDYSEREMFNKSLSTKKYKDGLLIVMRGHKFVKKSADNLVMITLRDNYEKKQLTGAFKILKINQEALRVSCDINWKEGCFKNQLVLYIIDPHVHKTKAIKIIIKNNKCISENIKRLRNLSASEKLTLSPPYKLGGVEKGAFKGRLGSLFDNFYELVEEGQWFLEYLIEHKDNPELFRTLLNLHHISKQDLLRIGWKASLLETLNNVNLIRNLEVGVVKKGKAPPLKEQNFFSGIVYMSSLSEKEAVENLNEIFDKFKTFNKFLVSESLFFDSEKNSRDFICKGMVTLSNYKDYMAFKGQYFLLRTEEGTHFGKHKIDVSDMTEVDCLLYWREIELIDIVSANMHKNKRCPMMFRNNKVINNLDLFDPLIAGHFRFQGPSQPLPKVSMETIFEDFKFSGKHILKEAMEQSTGYCFHENEYFQMRGDPIFKGMRFREDENEIHITLLDKDERYITECFDKKTCDFKYFAWSKFKISSDFSKECIDDIYIKIALWIRNFKIVVKRSRVLGFSGYRRPKDLNTDSKYYVYRYLPRSSYVRDRSTIQIKREKSYMDQNFTGPRRAHLRKLPDGYKVSKVQELLAKKLKVYLPPNYTYVKESKYGENGMSKREIIYRSKPLDGLFYYTQTEKSEFDKINEMSPAGFEEYCHELVEKNGWKVYKNTPIDGGIDIRALREEKGGKIKTLLVQCKLWRTPIPPGAVRDFKASCDDEEVEGEKQLMFISFSKFSPGATTYANQHNIMLVTGDTLIENNKKH